MLSLFWNGRSHDGDAADADNMASLRGVHVWCHWDGAVGGIPIGGMTVKQPFSMSFVFCHGPWVMGGVRWGCTTLVNSSFVQYVSGRLPVAAVQYRRITERKEDTFL